MNACVLRRRMIPKPNTRREKKTSKASGYWQIHFHQGIQSYGWTRTRNQSPAGTWLLSSNRKTVNTKTNQVIRRTKHKTLKAQHDRHDRISLSEISQHICWDISSSDSRRRPPHRQLGATL